MTHLFLENCVKSLPENIGDMKNLSILGLPKNQGLKLPDSIAKLIDNGLTVLLLADTGISEDSLSQPIKDAIERRHQATMDKNEPTFLLITNA